MALRTSWNQAHESQALGRGSAGPGPWWDPATGEINGSFWEDWKPDAFVHLAGENLAARRWSAEQKRRIAESRVEATARLVNRMLSFRHRPAVFIGASAVGYYGDRGEDILTEKSEPGTDELARVVLGWEEAASPLRAAGVRVVHFRFGMILSAKGGALARMVPIFKLGLGGPLGSGKQWMSWISLDDAVRAFTWAIDHKTANGTYNAVSPNPVRNREFTRALAGALHRPAFLPTPSPLLRLAFGEMAEAVLLASQRVMPCRLLNEGFEFAAPDLNHALRKELGEKRA